MVGASFWAASFRHICCSCIIISSLAVNPLSCHSSAAASNCRGSCSCLARLDNTCYVQYILPGFHGNLLLNNALLFCTQIGLVPGLSVGMGNDGPGCFAAANGLTRVSHYIIFVHATFRSPEGRCLMFNRTCLSDEIRFLYSCVRHNREKPPALPWCLPCQHMPLKRSVLCCVQVFRTRFRYLLSVLTGNIVLYQLLHVHCMY